VSANAGAAALDLICPAVSTGAMGNGQAGDGELDAVDGGGGHQVRCGVLQNYTGSGVDGQPTPSRSDRQGGGKAITLADRGGHDEPEVALAVVAAGGIQDACLLQVNHHGVDGALMAAGVHAHGANQVAAGHRAVVDQAGADRGADDGGEHRVRCVCSGIIQGRGEGVNPLTPASRSGASTLRCGSSGSPPGWS